MHSWRPIAHADTVNVKAGNVPQHSSVHSVRYEFVCLRCNLITKGVPVLVHDALIAMNHCSNSKEYQGGQSANFELQSGLAGQK